MSNCHIRPLNFSADGWTSNAGLGRRPPRPPGSGLHLPDQPVPGQHRKRGPVSSALRNRDCMARCRSRSENRGPVATEPPEHLPCFLGTGSAPMKAVHGQGVVGQVPAGGDRGRHRLPDPVPVRVALIPGGVQQGGDAGHGADSLLPQSVMWPRSPSGCSRSSCPPGRLQLLLRAPGRAAAPSGRSTRRVRSPRCHPHQ